jgi:hypothetical protein
VGNGKKSKKRTPALIWAIKAGVRTTHYGSSEFSYNIL